MKEVRGIVKVGHLPWMHREAIRFKRRGESRKRRRKKGGGGGGEKRMQTYPVISSDISAVYNRVSIVMRSSESPVIT